MNLKIVYIPSQESNLEERLISSTSFLTKHFMAGLTRLIEEAARILEGIDELKDKNEPS